MVILNLSNRQNLMLDSILSDSNDCIRLSSLADIDINIDINIKSLNTKFFDNSLSIFLYYNISILKVNPFHQN